jgi:hypothetical protein
VLIAGVNSGCVRGRLGLVGRRRLGRSGAVAHSFGLAIGRDEHAGKGRHREYTTEEDTSQDRYDIDINLSVYEGGSAAPREDKNWTLRWRDEREFQIPHTFRNVESSQMAFAQVHMSWRTMRKKMTWYPACIVRKSTVQQPTSNDMTMQAD